MKYCKQCGRQNEDDKKFCTGCGISLLVTDSCEGKKNSKERKWKGILVCFLSVILIGSVLFNRFYFSNQQRLQREIENENWTNVEVIYGDMQATEDEEKATEILNDAVESYKQNYVAKKISYDDAIKKLEKLSKVSGNAKNILETIDLVKGLHESRIAFDLAEKYWAEEDYGNAIIQYRYVVETDENFAIAEKQIKEGKVLYKEQVISEIEEKAKVEQYEDVNRLINIADGILGKDEEITALFVKYELETVEKELIKYESQVDYASAIKFLDNYKKLIENNSSLQTKLESYKTNYKEQLFLEAKSEYEDQGYEAAISILQSSLKVIPNDADILAKIDEYKECEPIGLHNLLVLSTENPESLDNKYNAETAKDLYGNQYQGYFDIFSYRGEAEYVELLCEGKYSNVKGTYFVNKNVNEDYDIEFRIYADGVRVYSSGYINRKNKAVDFDVEISNAETITLEAYSTDGNFMGNNPRIYLTNACAYKKMGE